VTRAIIGGAGCAALALLSAGAAWAEPPGEAYYGYHMMGGPFGWGGMFLGPLFMLLVLAVVIVIVILAVRWLGGQAPGNAGRTEARTALDILRERFARGEIDREEFEDRRKLLQG